MAGNQSDMREGLNDMCLSYSKVNILLLLILLSCIRSGLRFFLVACCFGVKQWQPCGGVFDQVIDLVCIRSPFVNRGI